MAPVDEAALRALLDRAAIHDLLLRYARGVDRRDLPLVASCFTPDASYDGILGKGGVVDALAALGRAMARYEGTMHFLGNQTIELAGDRARSETYCVAHHRPSSAEGSGSRVVAVRYLDELVRVGGGWLICARVVKREWERGD
jgi:SnoaL-like domain